jgi:hypothetical protein
MVLADAIKRKTLSGDHELATGAEGRLRHVGIDEGAFLIATRSAMVSVSVVVVASIFEQLSNQP